MTYEELVEQARQTYGRADASGIDGHVAYQFNITGEAEGAFYLEVSDGKVNIEPYEYFDRDVLFTTTAETLIKIAMGKLDPVWAYTTGKLKVQGSIEKALLLKELSVSEDVSGEESAGQTADAAKEDGTEAADVKDAAKEAAKNLLDEQVEKLTGHATVEEAVEAQKEKIGAAVEEQKEKLNAELERQAAKLRDEAQRAGRKLVEAAEAQRTKLVEGAKNPLAKIAAEKAGDKLVEEAERQSAKLQQEAEAKIDALMHRE